MFHIITSITTLVSLLLVIGLMVRHNQDKKEIRDLQEQVCYAQYDLDQKVDLLNWTEERLDWTAALLHKKGREIDTLKEDLSILLLKEKLHSCLPLPPYEEESDLASVTHFPPTIFDDLGEA